MKNPDKSWSERKHYLREDDFETEGERDRRAAEKFWLLYLAVCLALVAYLVTR